MASHFVKHWYLPGIRRKRLKNVKRDDIRAIVELHIEQGTGA